MTRSAVASEAGAGAPGGGGGFCANVFATKRSENPTLATEARRTNSILVLRFLSVSFSMVLASFRVRHYRHFKGGQVFFHFFENLFERQKGAICLCLVCSYTFPGCLAWLQYG